MYTIRPKRPNCAAISHRKPGKFQGKAGKQGHAGENVKMHKFPCGKLSNPTIAGKVKIWYDWRIQVDYAYSTNLGMIPLN